MYNAFGQNLSIQTLASKLKYISVWKPCIVGIMITVFPCRLDVEELCDQCVNSTDCSRTCSDFTCTCDFNYNGTLCDECMHKTSITNTLGCLQAFTQATSSAGKCFKKFYVWLNWTLTIFIFTAFFGGVGRRVKFEEYVPHCPGNPRTAFLVMVFLAFRTKFQCHIFRLLYPPLSSLSFGVTKSRLEDSLKFLQTYSQVSASNMTFGYKVLTLPDSRTWPIAFRPFSMWDGDGGKRWRPLCPSWGQYNLDLWLGRFHICFLDTKWR